MTVAKLGKSLLKAAGKNSVSSSVTIFLDTGFPPLNKAISGRYKGGGFPVSRIVEMYGPESSGKTLIATKAMVNAQQMGGIAIFKDHEHSFDVELAKMHGLLVEEGDPWVYKSGGTFEESLDEVIKIAQTIRDEKMIEPAAPIMVVFDSLASMVPKSKRAKAIDGQGMHDSLALAAATSASFPLLAEYADELNMLVLFLNQTREKPGVAFGDPTTTPGGKAPKFYASVRISLSRAMIKNTAKEIIGQEITAKCVKNKICAPFKEAKWRYMFNEDGSGHFDVTGSMIEHLVELGGITKTGVKLNWDGKTYSRGQLAAKIEKDGIYDQLLALLPPDKDL